MKMKFAVVGCTHAPLHDEQAVLWAADQIREFEPDVVIHVGDLLEADGASRFPSEYSWTMEDEFEAGDEILHTFAAAAPGADLWFLEGNHDANISAEGRIDPAIRDLVDWRRNLDQLEENGGRWKPKARYIYNRKQGSASIGQVTFAHGYEAGVSSDENQSIILGVPYGLTVTAHTHRPKNVTQTDKTKTIPLPFWHANVGTLRDIVEVPYMERKNRIKWGQAVVLGEALVREDRRYPNTREWAAETRVFRTYNEILGGGS